MTIRKGLKHDYWQLLRQKAHIKKARRKLFDEYKRYRDRYRKLLKELREDQENWKNTIQQYAEALAREKEKRIELNDSWAKTCDGLKLERNGETQDRQEKEKYMHWYADRLQKEARKHTETKERLRELQRIEEAHRQENAELRVKIAELEEELRTSTDRRMSHGKWDGYAVEEVLDQEPNYLGWMLMNGQNMTIPRLTAWERSEALEAYFRSLRTR